MPGNGGFPTRPANGFTLLELIVVMTIMILATSMAVAVFKGESPAKRIENASLEFEEFCARVRFQALESGEDRMVVFDPDAQLFRMKIPAEFQTEGEEEEASGKEKPKSPEIEWKLPEKFTFGENFTQPDEEPAEDGTLELFRFFPDGSASGKRKLELKYGELQRIFDISALTGRITQSDGENEEK